MTNQFKYNLNKLRRVLNFIAYYIPCKLRIESEFVWISAGNAQTIKRISGHQIRLRKNHKFSLNKQVKSNIHKCTVLIQKWEYFNSTIII